MNEKPTIAIDNLRFSWPQTNDLTIDIKQWSLKSEERVFLYGPSGSGKSTLLNLIAGILLPQQGHVTVEGENLTQLKAHQRDRFRAKNMGIIFQQFNLVPYLSISDNICLSSHFSGQASDAERLYDLTSHLGLDIDLLKQSANQLSVGQQQRVAVARALYHKPKLIIADEPSSALDSDVRDSFIELLLSESSRFSSTVLFVSHDRSLASHFDTQIHLTELNEANTSYAE